MANKPHVLVKKLRFSRSELLRCIEGITPEEARTRMGQMNSISWMMGHLGCQEQRYWVESQGKERSELLDSCGWGGGPVTPPLDEALAAWREITALADQYLDTLTPAIMQTRMRPDGETIGTMLLRNIMHYWFHLGEAHAVRQIMGHKELPQFVGRMEADFYEPEE